MRGLHRRTERPKAVASRWRRKGGKVTEGACGAIGGGQAGMEGLTDQPLTSSPLITYDEVMKKYEKEGRTFSEWNLEVVPRVPIYIYIQCSNKTKRAPLT